MSIEKIDLLVQKSSALIRALETMALDADSGMLLDSQGVGTLKELEMLIVASFDDVYFANVPDAIDRRS